MTPYPSFLPKKEGYGVTLTYHMNTLQTLRAPVDFCVSLNQERAIEPGKTIRELVYHHPVYDPKGLTARREQDALNGPNRTHYCGAYWGYGFHEDGVNSALAVAAHFGIGLDACTAASTKEPSTIAVANR